MNQQMNIPQTIEEAQARGPIELRAFLANKFQAYTATGKESAEDFLTLWQSLYPTSAREAYEKEKELKAG
jgi:hypothetical protein